MSHRTFMYVRNIFVVFIALVFAGYPFVLYSGYFVESRADVAIRASLVAIVLLLSFFFVILAAHKEYEKRKKEDMIE